MPQGIIGQTLGIAAFPTFSTLAAQSAMKRMRRILADTLRLIAFLSFPASVYLMILGRPIVTILFQRGQFDAQATNFVTWALLFYAFSLVGLAAIEIIARAFYSLEDTWTPVLVGMLQLIAMWLLGLWLSNTIFPDLGWLQLGGVALGYSISTLLEFGLLLWLLRRKMNGIDGHYLLDGVWRMALASLIMAGITWYTSLQLTSSAAFWQLSLAGLAGGITYLLACTILRVDELQQIWAALRQRLKVF